MKILGHTVTLSSGRTIDLEDLPRQDGPDPSVGGDGFADEERREIAMFMIQRWADWGGFTVFDAGVARRRGTH